MKCGQRDGLRALAILWIALNSCASKPRDVPCFDGWTTTGSESSRVVEASPELLSYLENTEAIGTEAVLCVHELKSQRALIVIVPDDDSGLAALSLSVSKSGFDLIEKGIIVKAH